MSSKIWVDDCCFYVKNSNVAIEFSDLEILANQVMYDGKNTLVFACSDDEIFVVQNITPDIRILLKEGVKIMVILKKNCEIVGSYKLPLSVIESLDYEDNFFKDAVKLCEELEAKLNL